MIEYTGLVLFILGWIPYAINKEQKGKVHTFELRACFWSFTRQIDEKGNKRWHIRLLIIERLQGAIWAVLDFWQKNRSGPDA